MKIERPNAAMMPFVIIAVALGLFACGLNAQAQEVDQWTLAGTSQITGQVCSDLTSCENFIDANAILGSCPDSNENGSFDATEVSPVWFEGPKIHTNGNWIIIWNMICNDGSHPGSKQVNAQAPADSCPDGTAPPCEGTCTGTFAERVTIEWSKSTPFPAGGVCEENTNCILQADGNASCPGGSDTCLITVGRTDLGCSEPGTETDDTNTDLQCVYHQGSSWCTEPELGDENCGYYNDDYLCLDRIEDDECEFFGAGKLACGPNADPADKPQNGGAPLPADGAIADDKGGSIDIWDEDSVASASNVLGGNASQGDGSGPGTGTDGEGVEVNVELDFDDIIEQTPDESLLDDAIQQTTDDLDAQFDDLETSIGDGNEFDQGDSVTIDDDILAGFSSGGGCQPLVLSAGDMGSISITCAETANIRTLLAWVLSIWTALYLFHLVVTRPQGGS